LDLALSARTSFVLGFGCPQNLGGAKVVLTGSDLARIEQALSHIRVQGARYPASHQNLINR
jgi:hypothetical protein